jgi:hypothetical protein
MTLRATLNVISAIAAIGMLVLAVVGSFCAGENYVLRQIGEMRFTIAHSDEGGGTRL